LKEPLHSMLDAETLSYLFELLRERPRASDKILCGIAKEAGLEIPESAVGSYRKRLKILDLI
jgi:transposase